MRKLIRSVLPAPSTRCARSRRLLKVALGSMVVWAILPSLFGHRVVVINTSPSVAPGLYMRYAIEPAVGRIIDFRIPYRARPYVQRRTGQDGEDWYILKPIAAGPGDRVDTTGSSLVINGRATAPMPPDLDGAGRFQYGEKIACSRRMSFSFSPRASPTASTVAATVPSCARKSRPCDGR
jgi:type IV secretory pathway protease TraF